MNRKRTSRKTGAYVAILLCVLFVVIGIIFSSSEQSKPVVSTKKVHKPIPKFMKIKGLATVTLFQDMNADISYYGKVRKNPKAYHHLVGDDRIYEIEKAKLLFQYHYHHFAKYWGSMDDMKCDFLGAFLNEYHGLSLSETDSLVLIADRYVNP